MISSWPLGLALALLLIPPLSETVGWQGIMQGGALMCLIWALAIGWLYRDPPEYRPAPAPSLAINLSPREWVLVSLAGSVWGLFNVGYIVLMSFLPDLFAAKGFTLAEASGVVSLLGWAMIGLIPAGGYLADALGRPYALMIGTALAATVATALLPYAAAPVLVFGLVVVLLGLPAGPLAALPAAALRAQNRATGMGVSYTWFYVLMAILPAFAGHARDVTQDPAAPVLFAAALMLTAVAGLVMFYRIHRVAPAMA